MDQSDPAAGVVLHLGDDGLALGRLERRHDGHLVIEVQFGDTEVRRGVAAERLEVQAVADDAQPRGRATAVALDGGTVRGVP